MTTPSAHRKGVSAVVAKEDTKREPQHLSAAMFLGEVGGKQSKVHLDAFIDLEPSGARHLQPVRTAATAHTEEGVASLKVRVLNEEAMDALESVALELRRLDLSKTRVVVIPDALVTRLNGLRKLVLNFNRLTHLSFPESFGTLANLRELSVSYNQLTCLPKCWLKLRTLARLNLEGNKISSLNGIDALRRLAVLVLDNNLLDDLPKELCSLKRLEGLFAKRNRIVHIHAKIKNLRHLRVLNVSENKLESVSAEVFCLPKLEFLCLSHNQLSHLPTFSMQSFQGRRIALVDISENLLTRFPDHVLRVSDKLDLSNNRIKVIPGNIFKRYDKMTQQILDLRGNSTVSPPSEVCEAGLRAIIRYCCEADQLSLIYQGAKVYVFGARGAGKTSLVRTFIDKEPQLAEPEEQTDGISVLETISEISESMLPTESTTTSDGKTISSSVSTLNAKNLDEFTIKKSIVTTYWEYCGEPHLIPLFSHFVREPALSIIAFNASTYNTQAFRTSIGVWIDLVCTRYFKAYILLVATHVDKMSKAAVEAVCEQVLVDLRSHLREKLQLIDRDVRNIETNSTISSTLSEYYSHLLRIKDVEIVKVHGDILQLSAKTRAGYDELEDCLARVFKNMPTVYPHTLKSHPTKFADIETYTEDLAEKAPLMEWDKYSKSVARKFNTTVDKVAEVATYINLCGKVIWSPNDKFCSQYIVLRPQVLADALLGLLNFQRILAQSTSEEAAQPSFVPVAPDDPVFGGLSIKHFLRHGLVNLDFLKYLWTRLTPVLNEDQVLPIARLILDTYELGFVADSVSMDELTARDDDDSSSSSTERPSTARSDTGSIKQSITVANSEIDQLGTRVFLPAVKSKPTASLYNELSMLNNEDLQICAVYQIFTEGVPLLFERFCGRLRNSQMVIYRYWLDGVLARHAEHDHSIVRVQKQFLGDSPVMCIIVAAHCIAPTVTFPAINQLAKEDKSRVSSATGSTRSPYSSRPQSVHAMSTEPRPSIPSIHTSENGQGHPTVIAPPYTAVDRSHAENMWTILLPILRDLDDLLAEYPGLWFRRMLRCPVCREICFNAEWASREFHDETELNCRACNNAVPLFLLSQPKEKRKVEDLAKLRRDIMDKRMKDHDTTNNNAGAALNRQKRPPRLTKPQ